MRSRSGSRHRIGALCWAAFLAVSAAAADAPAAKGKKDKHRARADTQLLPAQMNALYILLGQMNALHELAQYAGQMLQGVPSGSPETATGARNPLRVIFDWDALRVSGRSVVTVHVPFRSRPDRSRPEFNGWLSVPVRGAHGRDAVLAIAKVSYNWGQYKKWVGKKKRRPSAGVARRALGALYASLGLHPEEVAITPPNAWTTFQAADGKRFPQGHFLRHPSVVEFRRRQLNVYPGLRLKIPMGKAASHKGP